MITLVIGPMFSGKTTELLAYERRFLYAKRKLIIVKWSKDNRYSETQVISHDGHKSKVTVYSVHQLSDLDEQIIENCDAVLIDEGQFFADLGAWCQQHSKSKQIVIAGLSGDYKQQPFQPIIDVMAQADNIIHCKSICSNCGNDAPFTIRLTADTQQMLVGSADMYQPRCRACIHADVWE